MNGLCIQWGSSSSSQTTLFVAYKDTNSYRIVVSYNFNSDGHPCYDEFSHRKTASTFGAYDGSSYPMDWITIGYV